MVSVPSNLVLTEWHEKLAFRICTFCFGYAQLNFGARNICLSIAMDLLLLNAIQSFHSMYLLSLTEDGF